jgi:hypothetical protein
MEKQPLVDHRFLITRLGDPTQTHQTQCGSSGRVISPTQGPLPDNTQHLQQTHIHATGGIRTHNPRKQATAAPRLRSRGHRDRQQVAYTSLKMIIGRGISGDFVLLSLVDVKLGNTFQKRTAQWSSLRYRRRENWQLVFFKPSYSMQDAPIFPTVSARTLQTTCCSLTAIVAQSKNYQYGVNIVTRSTSKI